MATVMDSASRCGCGGATTVIEATEGPHGSIRRLRRCIGCDNTFTTYELPVAQVADSLDRVRELTRELFREVMPSLAFYAVFRAE